MMELLRRRRHLLACSGATEGIRSAVRETPLERPGRDQVQHKEKRKAEIQTGRRTLANIAMATQGTSIAMAAHQTVETATDKFYYLTFKVSSGPEYWRHQ